MNYLDNYNLDWSILHDKFNFRFDEPIQIMRLGLLARWGYISDG